KKDVVKSSVKGVAIEFDHERLASIHGVPGKNGICEYIKDVWEESKYTKPLEITRRFANNETLTIWEERHLKLHGSTYMDHMMARRLVDLPRVMMRHMSYVISVKDHELPYGDWLTMVTRENGVWWVGAGKNRRRDDVVNAQEEEDEEEGGNRDLNLIGRLSLMRLRLRGIRIG
ncbi:hypothetical protein Dimus_003388, partial [Dionaea muscipula]